MVEKCRMQNFEIDEFMAEKNLNLTKFAAAWRENQTSAASWTQAQEFNHFEVVNVFVYLL